MTKQTQTEEAIFLAAMQLATTESRMAYVQQACQGDENLHRRLVELLASHDASRGPLDLPPPGIKDAATTDQPFIERPGTQIGPYKLLQQIGEGGMGVVYMAEQLERSGYSSPLNWPPNSCAAADSPTTLSRGPINADWAARSTS